MSRHTLLKAAVAATLPFAGVLPFRSTHPAPSKIAGTFNAKYAEQHPLSVADAQGHTLLLGRVQGVNRSTGATRYMDEGQVTSIEFGDLVQGNGPHQGYITFSLGSDTVISKWSGKVTTTMSNNTPMTSFAGTWTKVKGTGRYEGLNGKGTYKGHFVSATEYICDWNGEISSERLAAK
jgi:hypothetical protein